MGKYKGKQSKVDMISNLPDPVIHLILSGLPTTEEVVRTSILSRRWRYLWTSIPSIDIDYTRRLNPLKELDTNGFREFVYWVLLNKPQDLDSFRLCCGNLYKMSTVYQWIHTAVRRNVKLLDLRFCDEDEIIWLPHCLLTCGSLEVLKLSLFGKPLRSLPEFTVFSGLRVFELKSCKFDYNRFRGNFLGSCPLLEDLSLVNCMTYNLDLFCISCPKLKNLRIDNRGIQDSAAWIVGMCNLLEICCPKLVFLEFEGFTAFRFIFECVDSLKKVVMHPFDSFNCGWKSVCKLFAKISHVEYLSLHICLREKPISIENFPKSLPNLKTLELNTPMAAYNMHVVIHILTCSPSLESLHLIIQEKKGSSSSIEFLEIDHDYIYERVRMVNMTGVSALPQHLRLIKFLLKSSPVLETMSITPSVNMTTDTKLSFLTDVLKFQRASTKAEIIFLKDQL